MIIRLAGSHFTLVVIAISILIGTAGVMTDQIEFFAKHYQLNFIAAEVEMEETIVILVAAFGVFLEHRRWLLDRIYPESIPDDIDAFDRYSHDIGILLILTAILMESVTLLFLALNNWGIEFSGLKYAEITVLFAANLIVIVMITLFGWRLLRI